jgi:hypothetical protein
MTGETGWNGLKSRDSLKRGIATIARRDGEFFKNYRENSEKLRAKRDRNRRFSAFHKPLSSLRLRQLNSHHEGFFTMSGTGFPRRTIARSFND